MMVSENLLDLMKLAEPSVIELGPTFGPSLIRHVVKIFRRKFFPSFRVTTNRQILFVKNSVLGKISQSDYLMTSQFWPVIISQCFPIRDSLCNNCGRLTLPRTEAPLSDEVDSSGSEIDR